MTDVALQMEIKRERLSWCRYPCPHIFFTSSLQAYPRRNTCCERKVVEGNLIVWKSLLPVFRIGPVAATTIYTNRQYEQNVPTEQENKLNKTC